jgi:hypothetical protein
MKFNGLNKTFTWYFEEIPVKVVIIYCPEVTNDHKKKLKNMKS